MRINSEASKKIARKVAQKHGGLGSASLRGVRVNGLKYVGEVSETKSKTLTKDKGSL